MANQTSKGVNPPLNRFDLSSVQNASRNTSGFDRFNLEAVQQASNRLATFNNEYLGNPFDTSAFMQQPTQVAPAPMPVNPVQQPTWGAQTPFVAPQYMKNQSLATQVNNKNMELMAQGQDPVQKRSAWDTFMNVLDAGGNAVQGAREGFMGDETRNAIAERDAVLQAGGHNPNDNKFDLASMWNGMVDAVRGFDGDKAKAIADNTIKGFLQKEDYNIENFTGKEQHGVVGFVDDMWTDPAILGGGIATGMKKGAQVLNGVDNLRKAGQVMDKSADVVKQVGNAYDDLLGLGAQKLGQGAKFAGNKLYQNSDMVRNATDTTVDMVKQVVDPAVDMGIDTYNKMRDNIAQVRGRGDEFVQNMHKFMKEQGNNITDQQLYEATNAYASRYDNTHQAGNMFDTLYNDMLNGNNDGIFAFGGEQGHADAMRVVNEINQKMGDNYLEYDYGRRNIRGTDLMNNPELAYNPDDLNEIIWNGGNMLQDMDTSHFTPTQNEFLNMLEHSQRGVQKMAEDGGLPYRVREGMLNNVPVKEVTDYLNETGGAHFGDGNPLTNRRNAMTSRRYEATAHDNNVMWSVQQTPEFKQANGMLEQAIREGADEQTIAQLKTNVDALYRQYDPTAKATVEQKQGELKKLQRQGKTWETKTNNAEAGLKDAQTKLDSHNTTEAVKEQTRSGEIEYLRNSIEKQRAELNNYKATVSQNLDFGAHNVNPTSAPEMPKPVDLVSMGIPKEIVDEYQRTGKLDKIANYHPEFKKLQDAEFQIKMEEARLKQMETEYAKMDAELKKAESVKSIETGNNTQNDVSMTNKAVTKEPKTVKNAPKTEVYGLDISHLPEEQQTKLLANAEKVAGNPIMEGMQKSSIERILKENPAPKVKEEPLYNGRTAEQLTKARTKLREKINTQLGSMKSYNKYDLSEYNLQRLEQYVDTGIKTFDDVQELHPQFPALQRAERKYLKYMKERGLSAKNINRSKPARELYDAYTDLDMQISKELMETQKTLKAFGDKYFKPKAVDEVKTVAKNTPIEEVLQSPKPKATASDKAIQDMLSGRDNLAKERAKLEKDLKKQVKVKAEQERKIADDVMNWSNVIKEAEKGNQTVINEAMENLKLFEKNQAVTDLTNALKNVGNAQQSKNHAFADIHMLKLKEQIAKSELKLSRKEKLSEKLVEHGKRVATEYEADIIKSQKKYNSAKVKSETIQDTIKRNFGEYTPDVKHVPDLIEGKDFSNSFMSSNGAETMLAGTYAVENNLIAKNNVKVLLSDGHSIVPESLATDMHKNQPKRFTKVSYDDLRGWANAYGEALPKDMHKTKGNYYIPKEALNLIKRKPLVLDESAMGKVEKKFRDVTNFFKGNALLSVGYHKNNFLGNIQNLYIAGADVDETLNIISRGEEILGKSRKALGEYHKAIKSDPKLTIDQFVKTQPKDVQEALDVYRQYKVSSVAGESRNKADMNNMLDKETNTMKRKRSFSQIFKKSEGESVIKKLAEETKSTYDKVIHANFEIGQTADDIFRIGAFEFGNNNPERMAEIFGESGKTGKDLVERAFFDYGKMTDVERNYIKYLIPFYSFMKFNTARQFSQFFQNPKKQINTLKTLNRATKNSFGDDYENVPDYVKNNGGVSLGQNTYMTTTNPFADALDMTTNPLGTVANAVNPIFKLAMEIPSGVQLYNGQKIDNKLAYALQQLGGAPARNIPKMFDENTQGLPKAMPSVFKQYNPQKWEASNYYEMIEEQKKKIQK